jgi:hypothetical protein
MYTSESTPTHLPWATLCKSRLYPSVRGFGFGLWALPVKVMLCQTIIMATRFSGRGRIQRKTWCIGWDPMPELTITSAYVHSNHLPWATVSALMPESTLTLCQSPSWSSDLASDYRTCDIGQSTAHINKYWIDFWPKNDYQAQYSIIFFWSGFTKTDPWAILAIPVSLS